MDLIDFRKVTEDAAEYITHLENRWGRVTNALGLPEDSSASAVLDTVLNRDDDCRHTHTFRYDLPKDMPWYNSDGKISGVHDALQLVGCYICGKVWCRDFKA